MNGDTCRYMCCRFRDCTRGGAWTLRERDFTPAGSQKRRPGRTWLLRQARRLVCVAPAAMAMSGAAGKAPPGYRYNLVMATVVQNEAPFLPEWLE